MNSEDLLPKCEYPEHFNCPCGHPASKATPYSPALCVRHQEIVKACVQCGNLVEEARECYAAPTCYACLPRPEIGTIHFNTYQDMPITSNVDRVIADFERQMEGR